MENNALTDLHGAGVDGRDVQNHYYHLPNHGWPITADTDDAALLKLAKDYAYSVGLQIAPLVLLVLENRRQLLRLENRK